MKKKKILVVTDASFLGSGYGIYSREVLSRMHNSGKYEVAELGCYASVQSPNIKNVPWKFYPNAVEHNDERYSAYKSNPINQFGFWRFTRVLLDFKPDVVCTWTDYWMYAYQETNPLRKYFKWIQMPMVDSAPQKTEWLYTYANADIVLPYTNWAKNVLSSSCGDTINLFDKPANAGVNPEEFFPIEDKASHKTKILGKNFDVIGCVMRNQKRKLFAETLLCFRKYLDKLLDENKLDKYNNTILYLHTSYPEENGWDFPSLLVEHNLLDRVYFSYICRNCNVFFPSKFQDAITHCPKCKNETASQPNVVNSVSTNTLNSIYNLFDLFIQNSIAEGFGITQLEAASCGIPFASVDYSAMTEVAENLGGLKIPAKKMFRELETNADRAYSDDDFIVSIMYSFFNKITDAEKNNISTTIRDNCIQKYTWDHTYKVWDECIQSLNFKNKLSWDHPLEFKTKHDSVKVPDGLNPKEFIEYICLQIIDEPYLVDTAHIQSLIKDTVSKLVAKNGLIQSFDKNKVVATLDSHIQNKILCEQMRCHPEKLAKEDYLNVNNK